MNEKRILEQLQQVNNKTTTLFMKIVISLSLVLYLYTYFFFLNLSMSFSAGCRSLQDVDVSTIHIESLTDAASTAEGAVLSLWSYQEFREKKKRKKIPNICSYNVSNEYVCTYNSNILINIIYDYTSQTVNCNDHIIYVFQR